MIQARVSLMEGMQFVGTTPSEHLIAMDAMEEGGGVNAGARPLELLLVALGGCTGMDVISILRKKRELVTGYDIVVRAERAEEHPRVYTSITVEHVVRGKGISADAVERAIQLSDEKYCSVGAMLRQAAKITTSYSIVEEA